MRRLNVILFVLCLLALVPAPFAVASQESSSRPSLLRDYLSPRLLSSGSLEFSIDYLLMNDTVDIFDVRDSRVQSLDSALQSSTIGDLRGFQLQANYGLSEGTTLRAGVSSRQVELSFAEFGIQQADLAVRQRLWESDGGVQLVLDAGFRYGWLDDESFRDPRDLELVVNRFEPGLGVEIEDIGSHFVFTRNGTSVLTPRERGVPEVVLDDMSDQTPYLRLSASRSMGALFPSVFLEAGKSWVDSRVRSNFADLIPDIDAGVLSQDMSLDRDETYWKAGFGLGFSMPFGILGQLEYSFIQLSRDGGLDFEDSNHVLRGEVAYFFTDFLAIHLGGSYYRHLYNGVFPVLYNRFTQTGFDHDYGEVRFGLTYLYGK